MCRISSATQTTPNIIRVADRLTVLHYRSPDLRQRTSVCVLDDVGGDILANGDEMTKDVGYADYACYWESVDAGQQTDTCVTLTVSTQTRRCYNQRADVTSSLTQTVTTTSSQSTQTTLDGADTRTSVATQIYMSTSTTATQTEPHPTDDGVTTSRSEDDLWHDAKTGLSEDTAATSLSETTDVTSLTDATAANDLSDVWREGGDGRLVRTTGGRRAETPATHPSHTPANTATATHDTVTTTVSEDNRATLTCSTNTASAALSADNTAECQQRMQQRQLCQQTTQLRQQRMQQRQLCQQSTQLRQQRMQQ